jgi:hypothetical protein
MAMQDDVKAIPREAATYRLVLVALGLLTVIGVALSKVISYTPMVPLIVLAASLVSMAAAIRGGRLARHLDVDRKYVGGFLYTAIMGGIIMFIFSGAGTLGGAVGHLALQLNLSWPAVVICVFSAVYGIHVYRNIPS